MQVCICKRLKCKYVCVYVYVYVHIHVYVYVYLYVYVYVYSIYMYTRIPQIHNNSAAHGSINNDDTKTVMMSTIFVT